MGYAGLQKRQYQKDWIAKRRDKWFNDNGPCVKCGSWNNLEADHIDPSTKLFEPASLWSLSDKNPKKIAELKKLQVLCKKCHLEKSSSEQFIQTVHGAPGATLYRSGCRCNKCKRAQALRARDYRFRKRSGMV